MEESAPVPLWKRWSSREVPIRVGVSRCLMGESVRFDGGHCRDRFLTDRLGHLVEFVSACPEAELGLGVPRPAMRLEAADGGPRLVQPRTGRDLTDSMRAHSEARLPELGELDGFILKKGSPSCGMERVKLYSGPSGHKGGVGLFAAALMAARPLLPVEEDGRLNDPTLRLRFIERLYAHNRWRVARHQGLTRGRLVAFHTAHKLLLLAHDEVRYRDLGAWLGRAGSMPDRDLFDGYEERFLSALDRPARASGHVNVLEHAFGHLKRLVSTDDRRALRRSVQDYRRGLLPLHAPMSLLRFHVSKYDVDYLAGQLYLEPHPMELAVRRGA